MTRGQVLLAALIVASAQTTLAQASYVDVGDGYCDSDNFKELNAGSVEACFSQVLADSACVNKFTISYGKGTRSGRCLCDIVQDCAVSVGSMGDNGYDRLTNSAQYTLGDFGTNSCPQGYEVMTNVNACQASAGILGKTWRHSSSWPHLPRGCFHNTPNNQIHFNTHATGSIDADNGPVCEAQAATPLPTYAVEKSKGQCCRDNYLAASQPAADLGACEAACTANDQCLYFDYSTYWSSPSCHLCAGCDSTTSGGSQWDEYKSYARVEAQTGVSITSINHPAGATGKYFLFSSSDWSKEFGSVPSASGSTHAIQQFRNGVQIWSGSVVVWDNENGVNGRRDSGYDTAQFQVDDILKVVPTTTTAAPTTTTAAPTTTTAAPQAATYSVEKSKGQCCRDDYLASSQPAADLGACKAACTANDQCLYFDYSTYWNPPSCHLCAGCDSTTSGVWQWDEYKSYARDVEATTSPEPLVCGSVSKWTDEKCSKVCDSASPHFKGCHEKCSTKCSSACSCDKEPICEWTIAHAGKFCVDHHDEEKQLVGGTFDQCAAAVMAESKCANIMTTNGMDVDQCRCKKKSGLDRTCDTKDTEVGMNVYMLKCRVHVECEDVNDCPMGTKCGANGCEADISLWPLFGANSRCRRSGWHDPRAHSQLECQQRAASMMHEYYEYDASRGVCTTYNTCTKTRHVARWNIYKKAAACESVPSGYSVKKCLRLCDGSECDSNCDKKCSNGCACNVAPVCGSKSGWSQKKCERKCNTGLSFCNARCDQQCNKTCMCNGGARRMAATEMLTVNI